MCQSVWQVWKRALGGLSLQCLPGKVLFWSHTPLSFAPPQERVGTCQNYVGIHVVFFFWGGGGGKSAASREHQVMRRQTIQPNLPMCYLGCSIWPGDHIPQVEILLKKNPAFWFKQLSCQSGILVTIRIWYECGGFIFEQQKKKIPMVTNSSHPKRNSCRGIIKHLNSTSRNSWGLGTYLCDICHGWSTYPPPTVSLQKYGLKYGLLKGNQWIFISPDHKGPRLFLAGGYVAGEP